MKITTVENNLDKGLLSQPPFCFNPDVLGRANKMSIMTMSIASDESQRNGLRLSSKSVSNCF